MYGIITTLTACRLIVKHRGQSPRRKGRSWGKEEKNASLYIKQETEIHKMPWGKKRIEPPIYSFVAVVVVAAVVVLPRLSAGF